MPQSNCLTTRCVSGCALRDFGSDVGKAGLQTNARVRPNVMGQHQTACSSCCDGDIFCCGSRFGLDTHADYAGHTVDAAAFPNTFIDPGSRMEDAQRKYKIRTWMVWAIVVSLSVVVPIVLFLQVFRALGSIDVCAAYVDRANLVSLITAIVVPMTGFVTWITFRGDRAALHKIALVCLAVSVAGFAVASVLMLVAFSC